MRQYPFMPKTKHPERYVKRLSISNEDGDLLYALVRMTKPQLCVETGCYNGDSSHYIGSALRDNHFGELHTCDVISEHVARARKTVHELPVTVHECSGIELLQKFPVMDFVFIDSGEPPVRRKEILSIGGHNISPLGIVAWHDACAEADHLYEAFAPAHDWPHLIFPSLVGIAIFQRPE